MIESGRLDDLGPLENWFRSRGHRLDFELTRAGWSAVVLPSDRRWEEQPLLSAEASDPMAAARMAHEAFVRVSSGE
jgi:hypothetical protein